MNSIKLTEDSVLFSYGGYRSMPWQSGDGSIPPLPVRLYMPEQLPGVQYPLVLFLHGAGDHECSSSQLT